MTDPQGAPPPTPPDPGTQPPDPPEPPGPGDGIDWKARAAAGEAEAEKWKSLARKHEDRAKENADAASKTRTVEEQLTDLRRAMSERDVRDHARAAEHALDKVAARLAEAGIRRADVAGLLELVDSGSLLTDGQPDENAIGKFAASLTKVAGRATPDPDQGRSGGAGPADMSALIRRAAGRT